MATEPERVEVFEGRSTDAEAPFLSGEFWQVGKIVRGELIRRYETILDGKPSPAIVLELDDPIEIDGDDWDRVSIGNLAGVRMAAQEAKDREGRRAPIVFRVGDDVEIECESIKQPKKEGYSPRPNFHITVRRKRAKQ